VIVLVVGIVLMEVHGGLFIAGLVPAPTLPSPACGGG